MAEICKYLWATELPIYKKIKLITAARQETFKNFLDRAVKNELEKTNLEELKADMFKE